MSLTPLKALKLMVKALNKEPCAYCLVGGHAASLYRVQERFTKDVDFALVADLEKNSRAVAERAIKAVGLTPIVGFIPRGKQEPARRSICMITSTPLANEVTGMVDVLLPELPWVKVAVERAQANLIDLGFAFVPVITPEDLIVAKCFSVRNSPDRFKDLDDLKELLGHVKELDIDYLREKLATFSLEIPDQVQKYAPASLL